MSRAVTIAFALSLVPLDAFAAAVPPAARSGLTAPDAVVVLARTPADFEIGPGGTVRARDVALADVLDRYHLGRGRLIGGRTFAAPALDDAGPLDANGRLDTLQILRLSSDDPAFDATAAARDLAATGRLRAAVPDARLTLFASTPNDPLLLAQWYVASPNHADIALREAWSVTQGSSAVSIGIMDTGVDTAHPDLASQIRLNPREIPGNHIDDDGNGYVDDMRGWDFGDDDNDPNPDPVYDADGIDVGFHGTFVAAIASAATDNVEGIAGAGWSCRIVPLKVCNGLGEITVASVAAAFQYAAAMHLDVLNLSFGSPGSPGIPEFFQALVDQATASGVVCVAAAGNDGLSGPTYPAACANVIAVGATDEYGRRAAFSNWGPWVDIAAPGTSIVSAIARNYVTDDYSQMVYAYYFGWDGLHPYMYGDGTSFAAPLVSGVCGLIRSRWPFLLPRHVAQQVVATGDVVAFDRAIGRKLNAGRAVTQPLLDAGAPETPGLALAPARPNPFRRGTAIGFTLPQAGDVRLEVFDCAGRRVRELVHANLAAGSHSVLWDGTDTHGRAARSGVYFAVLVGGAGVRTQRLVHGE